MKSTSGLKARAQPKRRREVVDASKNIVGVLTTCDRNKEAMCTTEMLNWLSEVCAATGATGKHARCAQSAERWFPARAAESAEGGETSVSAALAKEIQELKEA
jgi:hypothetical protein